MTIRDVHLDFETYCDLDLKKVGVDRYVDHPSFEVLCSGWKVSGGAAGVYILGPPRAILTALLTRKDVQIHAWNAAFETAVLKRLGITPARSLSCTMQRALAYGLPGRLEAAGAALGAPVQKDAAGHKLMMKMSKPGKDGKRYAGSTAENAVLGAYCMRDVESEEAISDLIPQLSPREQELSILDAKMNAMGVCIDRARVVALREVAKAAEKTDAARCAALTGGTVTSPGTQTARLLAWFGVKGLVLPDVSRSTIEEALPVVQDPAVKEIMQIRLRTARGSTKKLNRMLDMADSKDVLRGQFQFCGAGRTGRWAGRGVQVQNLPRVPKGFSPDAFMALAKAAVQAGDPAGLDLVAPAPPLDCVAWSLRSCLAANGALMWGFDFSQIEARVLAWLAGQNDVLDVFRSGEDIYVWAAGQFGSTNRQLGKVLILALGYGMGAIKLRETAKKSYGVDLTAAAAESFKTGWRTRNAKIVTFWAEMAHAATQAILRRDTVFAVGGSGIAILATRRTLQVRLPSGRVLYYHKPRVLPTGELSFWGVELNQWTEIRTYGGKLAENVTQAVARDVMAEAMLRIERRLGLVPLMTVHDEIVYAVDNTASMMADLKTLALDAPQWAGGLPIAGEAKLMTRYGVPV